MKTTYAIASLNETQFFKEIPDDEDDEVTDSIAEATFYTTTAEAQRVIDGMNGFLKDMPHTPDPDDQKLFDFFKTSKIITVALTICDSEVPS